MPENQRACERACPNCGSERLYKPWAMGDCFEWDCFECGLEVPRHITAEGAGLLDLWEEESFRPILRVLFTDVNFGESQE